MVAKAQLAAAPQELQEYAASQGFEGELLWWDNNYWAERLKEARYSITDEELRPYFALPNVLDGLFKVGGGAGGRGMCAAACGCLLLSCCCGMSVCCCFMCVEP
jgi:hypothetical protein